MSDVPRLRILANAKLNLGLEVGSVRADGFHPVAGVFQSVTLSDRLEVTDCDVDRVTAWDGGDVLERERNLAWRAVVAMRAAAGVDRALHLRLDKVIPVAAGLGGGSADAGAGLWLAQRHLGADPSLVSTLAPDLGSDVPFCVVGGTAVVTGRGDEVLPLPPRLGYGIALVVPPVEVATAAVYRMWDEMDGPTGPVVPRGALPGVLSDLGTLRNDLYPAAVRIAPEIEQWRTELERHWDRPVLMSGSGPSLFAFFNDVATAQLAVIGVPDGARAALAVEPSPEGWRWEGR